MTGVIKTTFFVYLLCPLISVIFIFSISIPAQKLAVLIPEKTNLTEKFAGGIRESLSHKFVVIDDSLSETAFRSVTVENTFNMTAAESKLVAAVIGCDFFLIIRTETLRRSSFEKPEYYEAFNVTYLVSGRTGHLVFWDLRNFEADTPAGAEKLLFSSTADISADTAEKLRNAAKDELSEKRFSRIEEVPFENSSASKNLRPPVPYKRIKPEYTRTGYLYDARGTVDILVDIDEKGSILRTEIIRWAGYGLEESVVDAVKKMNWRPAERDGKALPMRVLLRYNFTKIEKE